MIRIMFVCHGNICRSPMAEFIMKDLVRKENLTSQFVIASSATSTEEFGITNDGQLVLADEISPDTCRFWDTRTGEKLDKDRFRRDLGNVEDAYIEIRKRLMGE